MRIMTVDDEKFSREGLGNILREQFPEAVIEEYGDGVPAWKAVMHDHQYDLVITDIRMIEMDGVELAEKIHEKFPEMQILFQSAESAVHMEEMGIQLERCLCKPLNEKQVKEKIEHLEELPPFEIKGKKQREKETEPEQIFEKHKNFFGKLFQR